jgi:hypothetical protein
VSRIDRMLCDSAKPNDALRLAMPHYNNINCRHATRYAVMNLSPIPREPKRRDGRLRDARLRDWQALESRAMHIYCMLPVDYAASTVCISDSTRAVRSGVTEHKSRQIRTGASPVVDLANLGSLTAAVVVA